MPYTPPAQPSPASSTLSSPLVSRASSYHEDIPRSPSASRPQPPRSMSSASYMQRCRRSPSITKSEAPPPTTVESSDVPVQVVDFANNSSVRQSPPPMSKQMMPNGAVISPPDSNDNSDGDDTAPRGRDVAKNWDQLKEAVRAIDHRRESSPNKLEMFLTAVASEPAIQGTPPTALSTEARKISHSRSSTETAITTHRAPSFAESSTTNSDDSDEDGGLLMKPSLVRKKSGELVKPALRGSSRRRYSSMPGTPTYSKSVHFNDNGNQTRHFLQVDKPTAVSAGTSPVEGYESESEFPFDQQPERGIKLANFPPDSFERQTRPVRVERIFLSPDRQTLMGTCAVQNIAFHKLVVARFTVDGWQTTSEVVAEYNNVSRSAGHDGCDRFNFQIKLSDQANIDEKTLLLCIRYSVGGQDFWDNNNDANYQVEFTKGARPGTRRANTSGLGARPSNAIPRSRHSPSSPALSKASSLDDDFATRPDTGSAYQFGNADSLLGDPPHSIKLKPRNKRGSLFVDSASVSNGLGGRYDFGASLSAALGNAQSALGNQSGLTRGKGLRVNTGSYFGEQDRNDGPTQADARPATLASSDRPAIGSEQYKDLVSKFCYFTPAAGKSASLPQPGKDKVPSGTAIGPTDGANDEAASSLSDEPLPSLSLTERGRNRSSPGLGPCVARSASPVPATDLRRSVRIDSPVSSSYPYRFSSRDGYLSDSPAPMAIHG